MADSYLVVGGGGFLGGHIVELLLARGEAAVAVFDLVPAKFDPDRVKIFVGDMTDEKALSDAVKACGATCIMHTAAVLPGKPRAVQELVNVQGTVNVINAAHANGVTKLVFTSSASVVYGGKDQAGVDETEKYPAVPFDDYNDTKAIAESKVLAANGTDGLCTCSLRPAGIFGPKDVKGPVPAMMNMAAKGNSHVQLGSSTNLYDWTYVTNIADAHLLAADRLAPTHPKHALVAGQAFFISNGDPRPWWDFPRMLWRAGGFVETRRRVVIPRPVALVIAFLAEVVGWITGKEPTLTRFRIHYICTERWCNISKAREALDYEPRVSLEEGARISAEWWKSQQST